MGPVEGAGLSAPPERTTMTSNTEPALGGNATLSAQDRPPPCGGPVYRERHTSAEIAEEQRAMTPRERRLAAEKKASATPSEHPFSAKIDLAELDERGRPGPVWRGMSVGLSRSSLRFQSRRLCYIGREVLVAIHQIDDRPVPLFGRVVSCQYDGDGTHEVELALDRPDAKVGLTAWANTRPKR
jgi:hypothetical protein